MPEDPKPFRCSICEQLRDRDTNHWWLVRKIPSIHHGAQIEIFPWNSVLARRPHTLLACGLNCLMTAAGRAAEALLADAVAVAQGARRGPEVVDLSPSPECPGKGSSATQER